MDLSKLRLIFNRFPSQSPVFAILGIGLDRNFLIGMDHCHKLGSFHFDIGMRDFWIHLRQQKQGNVDDAHRWQNRIPRKVTFKRWQILINRQIGHNFGIRFFRNFKLKKLRNSFVHCICFANAMVWGQVRP